jgi:Sec23/Sec24 zinc finger
MADSTSLLQVTPLQRLENCPALAYEPVLCRSCPCVLNPYCGTDFSARAWRCPLW